MNKHIVLKNNCKHYQIHKKTITLQITLNVVKTFTQ